jgi:hypothetical protein
MLESRVLQGYEGGFSGQQKDIEWDAFKSPRTWTLLWWGFSFMQVLHPGEQADLKLVLARPSEGSNIDLVRQMKLKSLKS